MPIIWNILARVTYRRKSEKPVPVNEAGLGRDNDRLSYWTRNYTFPGSKG